MRRLLAIALLLLAAPAWGAQKYLRTDGNDACNGGTDAAGSSGDCAWLTLNFAVNNMAASDDLIIKAGTYSGAATRTTAFGGTSGDQMVIQGDPGAARSAVILDGNSATSVITIGTAGVDAFNGHYITLQHFTIRNADKTLIDFPSSGSNQLGNIFQDIHFDDNPSTLCCSRGVVSDSDPNRDTGFALRIGRGYSTQILNNLFEGDPADDTVQGITGSDATVIWLAGNNTTATSNLVQGNTASNWLGGFVREGSRYARIRDNITTNLLCATDDGCVQVYNDYGNAVTGNVFWDSCVWTSSYAFVSIRSTPGVGCQSSFHAAASVFNNTLKLSSSCTPTSSDTNTKQRAIWRNSLQCQNGTVNEDVVFINNLIVGPWYVNTGAGGTIDYSDSTPLCPASPRILRVDHNMFYQALDEDIVGASAASTCTIPVALGTGDVSGTDPQLDGSYAPTNSGNAVCGGATDYTDYSGVTSKSWIGALQGACGGAVQSPSGVKLYGALIRGGRIP